MDVINVTVRSNSSSGKAGHCYFTGFVGCEFLGDLMSFG